MTNIRLPRVGRTPSEQINVGQGDLFKFFSSASLISLFFHIRLSRLFRSTSCTDWSTKADAVKLRQSQKVRKATSRAIHLQRIFRRLFLFIEEQ